MQALRTSTFDYKQFKDRNSSRLRDTCQWVLHHDNFRNWKDSSSSSLLWISADPGCGKSVFTKSLAGDLKNTDGHTTCYFFFKDDDVQKSAVTALAALLHQLFRRKPTLIKYTMLDFAANGDKLSQPSHTLWSILIKTVADRNTGEVFCVLDALDECAEAGQYQIITALSSFYQQAISGNNTSQLKICVTSHPYPDIKRRFTDLTSNFPTIRLRGKQESDKISHEINQVIKWRVSQFGSELKLNNSEQSNLETELLTICHRTYLRVTLIFDIIRKMIRPTSRKLKAVISGLPSTVDEAYEAILTKMEEDDRPQARKLLYIVVGATRPLTLKEMNIALDIEDHHRSYNDLEPDLDDKRGLKLDRNVYLIHQTAKEFLLTKSEAAAIGWKHSLVPTDSELLMARVCLIYLSLTEFDRATDQISAAVKHGYLDYAVGSWAAHYRKAQHSATEQMLHLRFKSRFDVYWSMAHQWHSNPQFTRILMVESYFGQEGIVKLLLEAKANVDSKDKYGQTPLWWAAENGREGVVKLLMSYPSALYHFQPSRRPLSKVIHALIYSV
ncbi:hypothetical protein P152DRAFT_463500 [Eremomyces bilateralis CBS 781.70]|uniref:NACHT domain-containing protein n=1 Tax=Eremomyces bilateralis CBS 781.70 TaxID=1392243 RepID=A0A6G1GH82_9PEZI|nr:uncharacterized protein P152DRAFT_463500 [Eremomyces bilateralis CBS 781.70]KAF1817296.1 hypothetical protein P152DRAFT_463500 [Eremomyces bilateralis CBS 781.70]